MSAGIAQGTDIIIETSGDDEIDALDKLVSLVESGFGEETR
ncbi:MAG: HPr family phosphocarrier protein [Eubacteriaceae bacterium]|nr:HPr family phosphocarrier protein [Eubacteriaceae bacterium]